MNENGQISANNSTFSNGEITVTPKKMATLEAICARDTGPIITEIRTSYDKNDPIGRMTMVRHLSIELDKDHKTNDGWYGKKFDLVAYTATAKVRTKDHYGADLEKPEAFIFTTFEDADGNLMQSGSSWVYRSLCEIIGLFGEPSIENPIKVRLGKAGNADKLFAEIPATIAKGKQQKSK